MGVVRATVPEFWTKLLQLIFGIFHFNLLYLKQSVTYVHRMLIKDNNLSLFRLR